jgi:beta-glucanase (GH16 family)
MTNRLSLLLLTLTISISNCIVAQTWIPIWADEFNYTGLPDPSKWTYDVGGDGWGNAELQYYTDARTENARVENGNLIIEAKQEAYHGSDYTSARLISKGLGDWKYGKIEVRAKLPTGNGMWPAIWMLPTENIYGNWPKSGEIDIMENVGHDTDNIHWNVHTESYNHSIGTNKGSHQTFTSPSSNFYTYAVEWYEDSIRFLVDDVEYFQFDKESEDYKVWPFKEKFHLLLNVSVGGSWGSVQGVDNNIFPQTMEVDYVRVYKQDEQQANYSCDVLNLSHGLGVKSPDANSYAAGTSVQLSTQADNGFVFNKWYGTVQSSTPNLNLTMNLNYSQIPEFLRSGEMINNSQFLGGNTGWGGYGATMAVDSGIYTTSISSTTANLWDIQMYQQGLVLVSGESYTVTVVASASQARDIKVALGMASSPWTSYGNSTLALTTTTQTFTFQANLHSTDSNARIVFDLGQHVGDVKLEEVSVVKNGLGVGVKPGVKSDKKRGLIKVWPNPATSHLYVDGVETFNYRLYDIEGRLVKSGREVTGGIDVTSLKSGVYSLRLNEGEVSKVIVK